MLERRLERLRTALADCGQCDAFMLKVQSVPWFEYAALGQELQAQDHTPLEVKKVLSALKIPRGRKAEPETLTSVVRDLRDSRLLLSNVHRIVDSPHLFRELFYALLEDGLASARAAGAVPECLAEHDAGIVQ